MISDSPARGAAADPEVDVRLGFFGGRGRWLLLGVVVLGIVWLARGIIGPFVVAAVAAYAFTPVVSAIEERTHLPRALIIGLGYVLVLGATAVAAVVLAERVNSELTYLSTGGTDVFATALHKLFGDHLVIAGQTYDVNDVAAQIRTSLLGAVRSPTDAIRMAEQAVEVVLQAVLALIITFYFLLDGRRFGEFAIGFLDRSQRGESLRIARRIHVVLGRWLRGQLLLIALVSVVLYVILGPVLHVPYALVLALFSGVLEIVPLVGPIIAAALAGTVAFATHGTDTTIVVLVVYLIVRQIEDQIVMPLVIGRAVHLHPVVTIFAVMVGLSAWGVLGGLLGVPVAAALNVTLHELYPQETKSRPEPRRRRGIRVRLRPKPPVSPGASRSEMARGGATDSGAGPSGAAAESGAASGAAAEGATPGDAAATDTQDSSTAGSPAGDAPAGSGTA